MITKFHLPCDSGQPSDKYQWLLFENIPIY